MPVHQGEWPTSFDATLQEQEDWEELMDQSDHQAAVMVQMAIIAE